MNECNGRPQTKDQVSVKLLDLLYLLYPCMVGFCFGIGVILAVKTVNSFECCIEELISR